MEEQSSVAADSPASGEAAAQPEQNKTWRGRAKWLSRVTGVAIFLTLLAWSQSTESIPSTPAHRAIGVVLITLGALYTLLIVTQAGRANVKLERSYSEHLERLSESLRHLAYHDSLTGLYNHRYFHDRLRSEIERARRYGHQMSVVMLDVNHFKEVNDRHGHLTGDELLSFLGRLIGENVRAGDIAARYGGDEFALILPETDSESARRAATKIREVVSKRRDWGAGVIADVALDIAAGVATFPEDAVGAEDLLHEADRALYASKDGAPPFSRRRRLPAHRAM
jgi:diguanylate cyclase (GGDEF)-like protein